MLSRESLRLRNNSPSNYLIQTNALKKNNRKIVVRYITKMTVKTCCIITWSDNAPNDLLQNVSQNK